MKKILKSMVALVAAAAALTACKADLTESVEQMRGVSFSVEEMDEPEVDAASDQDEIETRTIFGSPTNSTIPVLWTANQQVCVIAESPYGSTYREYSVVPSQDAKTAKFTGSSMNLSYFADGYFVLLSPQASFVRRTAGEDCATITIPETQTPTASSPDETAMILGAKTSTYATAPTSVKFRPKHMTAYLALSLKNSKVVGVQSVSVQFIAKKTIPLVGEAKFDYSGTTPKITSTSDSGNNIVTAHVTSLNNIVWLAVLPANVSGTKMRITVTGRAGSTETLDIFVPAGKNLTAGKIATLTVDMNPSVAVTGVSVTPTTLSLPEGGTGTLTATVTPSNATDKTVTWSSSNTAVATVSSSGEVKGVKPGTATITVKTNDGAKTATCAVTVQKVVSYLQLLTTQAGVEPLYDDDALHITPTQSATLQYRVVYSDGSISTNSGARITIDSGSGVSLSGSTLTCTSVGQTAKVKVAALDPGSGAVTGHAQTITVKTWSDPTSVSWAFNVPVARGARWCKTGETYYVAGTVQPSTARQKVVLEARQNADYWELSRTNDKTYSLRAPAISASSYNDYLNKTSVLRLSAWQNSSVYSDYTINVTNIDVSKPKMFDYIAYDPSIGYRILDGGLRIYGNNDDFYCSDITPYFPPGTKVVGIVTYYPENPKIQNPYPMYSCGVSNLEALKVFGPDDMMTQLPSNQFHGIAISMYNADACVWSYDNDNVDADANWSQELSDGGYASKTQLLDSQKNNGYMLMIAGAHYNGARGGSHTIWPVDRAWRYGEPSTTLQCHPFPKTNPSVTLPEEMKLWFVPTVYNWEALVSNGKYYNTKRMNKLNEQITKAGFGDKVFPYQTDAYWTINTDGKSDAYIVYSEGRATRAKSAATGIRLFMIF